jgi:integrase
MEGDRERGDYHDPRAGRKLYGTVYSEWLAGKHFPKERTKLGYVSLYENHINQTFAPLPVGKITKPVVKAWVAERLNSRVGVGTIRNALRNVLKPSLDAAVDAGYLRANPALGVKLPQSEHEEMLFLDATQVRTLAEEITPPFGTLVLFAAYIGLRAGEIAALRVGRLDFLRRTIDVRESATDINGRLTYTTPKTKTSRRTLPLPSFLVEPLTQLIAPYADDPNAFVFRSPDGGPLRHGNFYARAFKPAVVRALPPTLHGLRFHDLRHTAAALMIDTGADPYSIMRRLGHSSISVTFDRYGHRFPERDAAITEGLEATYRSALPSPVAEVVPLR